MAALFGMGALLSQGIGALFRGKFGLPHDGHFPGHHRDGVTAEAWLPLHLSQRLTLSAGTGPFYYYDTTTADNRAGYADVHDWAWLYSLDLIYQPWDKFGLFFDLRLDHTAPARSIVGCRFRHGEHEAAHEAGCRPPRRAFYLAPHRDRLQSRHRHRSLGSWVSVLRLIIELPRAEIAHTSRAAGGFGRPVRERREARLT